MTNKVHVPPRGLYGTGHYVCPCVSIAVPSTLVEAWLPKELRLLPQRLTAPGWHPFTLLLGQEDDVYASWFPWFRMDYREFAVVVPYVGWREPEGRFGGPFLFTPHLFIDRFLPIQIGRLIFGFAKAQAPMQFSREALRIDLPRGGRAFEARFSWTKETLGLDERRLVTALLQQPSISETLTGHLVCSGFFWDFPSAQMETMRIHCHAEADFLPGIRDCFQQRAIEFTSDLARGTAFLIETRWRLTGPMSPELDWSGFVSDAAREGLL